MHINIIDQLIRYTVSTTMIGKLTCSMYFYSYQVEEVDELIGKDCSNHNFSENLSSAVNKYNTYVHI